MKHGDQCLHCEEQGFKGAHQIRLGMPSQDLIATCNAELMQHIRPGHREKFTRTFFALAWLNACPMFVPK